MSTNEKIEELRHKLRRAKKYKINKDKELRSLRTSLSSINEELAGLEDGIEFSQQQLEEQKEQIVKAQNNLTIVEMYNICEKTKNERQQKLIEEYKKDFLELFEKERINIEKVNNEQRRQEEAQQEIRKEKKLQVMMQNEEQMIEILAVEAECDKLEQECTVLKKRNKAIMLQLRRKLIETDEARKALLNNKPGPFISVHTNKQ